MLSLGEIARGTQGALGFLRQDRTAPSHFDNTMAACLRSFRLIVLVAPLQAILLLLIYSNAVYAADDLEVVLVETLRYIVDWLLFPVIFYEIARRYGWLGNYPRYISALNWMNLPGMIIALALMMIISVMPIDIARLLGFAFDVFIVYWIFVTTRITLGANWLVTAGLTLLNWVPSRLLSWIVAKIIDAGLPGT